MRGDNEDNSVVCAPCILNGMNKNLPISIYSQFAFGKIVLGDSNGITQITLCFVFNRWNVLLSQYSKQGVC